MKLLLIITNKKNQRPLKEELLTQRFQLTKFDSEGGFLGEKNTTFLLGLEDQKLEQALNIIKKNCPSRTEVESAPPAEAGLGETFLAGGSQKFTTTGAIVFVLNVDQFHKF